MKTITATITLIGLTTAAASAADIKSSKYQDHVISTPPVAEIDDSRLKDRLGSKRWLANNQDKLDELKDVDRSRNGKATLPEREMTDPANGTGLDGRNKIERDKVDAGRLVRDLFRLREGGHEAAGIGRSREDTDPLRQKDSTATGRMNAPVNPGHSASMWAGRQWNHEQRSSSFKGTYVDSNGLQHRFVSQSTIGADGATTNTVTVTVLEAKTGKVVDTIRRIRVIDADGVVEQASSHSTSDNGRYSEASDAYNEEVAREHERIGTGDQGAPNDNDVDPKANPCSPTSNFGCGRRQVKHIDKITSPVHGDEVKTLAGTGGNPSAGPSSVTNPGTHDGSTGRSGGRKGGKPGEIAVDPEEIIPPIGGAHR